MAQSAQFYLGQMLGAHLITTAAALEQAEAALERAATAEARVGELETHVQAQAALIAALQQDREPTG